MKHLLLLMILVNIFLLASCANKKEQEKMESPQETVPEESIWTVSTEEPDASTLTDEVMAIWNSANKNGSLNGGRESGKLDSFTPLELVDVISKQVTNYAFRAIEHTDEGDKDCQVIIIQDEENDYYINYIIYAPD